MGRDGRKRFITFIREKSQVKILRAGEVRQNHWTRDCCYKFSCRICLKTCSRCPFTQTYFWLFVSPRNPRKLALYSAIAGAWMWCSACSERRGSGIIATFKKDFKNPLAFVMVSKKLTVNCGQGRSQESATGEAKEQGPGAEPRWGELETCWIFDWTKPQIVTNRVLFRVRLYFEKISSYDGGNMHPCPPWLYATDCGTEQNNDPSILFWYSNGYGPVHLDMLLFVD